MWRFDAVVISIRKRLNRSWSANTDRRSRDRRPARSAQAERPRPLSGPPAPAHSYFLDVRQAIADDRFTASEARHSGRTDRAVGARTDVLRHDGSNGAAAVGHSGSPSHHERGPRPRLLEGDGIGSITFGQLRSTVIAGLERLHGPAHETIPGTCGFGRSPDWTGLNISGREAHLTIDRGGTCSGSTTSISAVAPTSPQCAQERVSSHEPILGVRNPISVSSEREPGRPIGKSDQN